MTVFAVCANSTDIFAQYTPVVLGLYGIMPPEKGENPLNSNAFVLSAAACVICFVAHAVGTSAVRFSLGAPSPGSDGNRRVTIAQEDGWTPVDYSGQIQSGSALDFSALRPTGFRAGEYGRVVARGGHFEFTNLPGTPQRFWGVNLNYGATTPPEDEAEKIADRLARLGYNSVRLHHHDANIVRKAYGGVELDKGKMRKMDALIAACARHGIYVSTDLFVSRTKAGIPYRAVGIDRDGNIEQMEYKELLLFHEGVVSNYLEFASAFLNHVNVFTGVRYADDPAIAFISLVNENEFGNFDTKYFARHDFMQKAWKDWLVKHIHSVSNVYDSVPIDVKPSEVLRGASDSPVAMAFLQFVADAERRFVIKIKRFIRDELMCQTLITDLNGWKNRLAYQPLRAECLDYVDTHFYIDHPLPRPKGAKSPFRTREAGVNQMRNRMLAATGFAPMRVFGKPFTVTEFNYCAPGRFRALGNLAFGCMAALQDWSGLWRFTYGHDAMQVVNPVRCARIGSFNGASDPLSIAADKAMFALFVMGCLSPLPKSAAIAIDSNSCSPLPAFSFKKLPWDWVSWYFRTGTYVGRVLPSDLFFLGDGVSVSTISSDEIRKRLFPSGKSVQLAGDGSVLLDPERGSIAISTTCCAGGYAECGDIRTEDVCAEMSGGGFGVWAVSLDGKTIRKSRRLLVVHVTDAKNSGAVFSDGNKSVMLERGRSPMLMRSGKASISLASAGLDAKVFALADDGRRLREVPISRKNGRLMFFADIGADPKAATIFYECIKVEKCR